jgi:predicted 3-demethylubiquinone-9 3-methyltransferase (glyoxalase superfamily)
MPKVVTCLGFNNNGEEAINFYTSLIKNSKILTISRSGDAGPGPKGSMLAATFTLDGQEYMALNGGPQFTFSIGMSLMVRCDNQAEIDELWEKLSAGGQEVQCGWLTDKFGVSWQIVPRALSQWMSGSPAKAQSVMQALLKMTKLDIAALQRAHDAA